MLRVCSSQTKSDKHVILFICNSFILSLLTGIQRFEHKKEQEQRFLEKFLNVWAVVLRILLSDKFVFQAFISWYESQIFHKG